MYLKCVTYVTFPPPGREILLLDEEYLSVISIKCDDVAAILELHHPLTGSFALNNPSLAMNAFTF